VQRALQVKYAILVALLMLVSACGFHLKEGTSGHTIAMPVAVQGLPEVESMQFSLQKALVAAGADIIGSADNDAPLAIFIKQQQLARRVIARDSTGRPREYLLRLSVTLDYRWQDEPPASQTFSAERLYTYSQDQLLATHREERLYITEMQQQLAEQMTAFFSRLAHSSPMSHAD
jgi:LPS-assembly lipoprotein